MTELENCMESLILIFHRYTGEQGGMDGKTLSKKELKKLLEEQLPNFSHAQKNPKVVDRFMKDLDLNKDDKLDFEEFIPLFVSLSMTGEKSYGLQEKKASASAAMTELENCKESLIRIFHRYAAQHGDGKTLSKKELKKLLEEQLPNFSHAQQNPKVVDRIMEDLDLNKDDKLDFEEFIPLFVGLSMTCEKCYVLQGKKGKK